MGYGDKTLAKNPSYAKAHLERNERNVQRGYNHPSIIFWSLGNEAGMGPNFEKCYTWIKNEDKSRAVQYEQAGTSEFTDISTDGICKCKELLLNVAFKLKKAETLLPAGYTVAKTS